MIGIKVTELRDYVVEPTLNWMVIPRKAPHDTNLLLGTAAQESKLGHWLDQTTPGPGPAFGPWQMERLTFQDHCNWMVRFSPRLWRQFNQIELPSTFIKDHADELGGNLYLACFMSRVHYWRIREPLPTDLAGYAYYWKRYYNTYAGKGRIEDFIRNYKELVEPWVRTKKDSRLIS